MRKPIAKTAGQNIETTLSLLNNVLGSSPLRDVAVRLWDGTIWKPEPGSPTRCTLVLQHPGALRKMFLPPTDLRLGEAYIHNDFDIEGEIEAILPLIEHFKERRWGKLELLRYGARLLSLPRIKQSLPDNEMAKMRGRLHSKERDHQAIAYHYDLSNDFFALWLDSRMIYTCAYFATPDDDLERAQEYKLNYVCRKLRLRPRERLLDLGCGWGGLVIYGAQNFGVEADGITLSAQQAAFARERVKKAGLQQHCCVEIRDYREVNNPKKYDKLAAIGLAEHVGEALLPTFFKCAWELLRPGGVFLNQAIGVHSGMPIPQIHNFVDRYVFPDVEPVPVSAMLRAAEAAGFEVRDVENLRDHYAYTLRHWIRRLEENAGQARQIVGETVYRCWRLFLVAGLREITVGPGNLYQTLLVKPEKRGSGLPLRREDWYA
jgi:cyclopropane-fatty-acyl-phospholipid synthase